MSNLSESLQVLKGELAKGIFKAVKKLIPALTKMADWLGKNHKIVEAIAIPLLTFLNVLTALIVAKKVALAIKALVLVLNTPIGMVAAISAIVVAIIYLWNNCEAFRNFFINMWNNIKSVVQGFINFFLSIPQIIGNLVNNIITFLSNIPYYIGYMIGWIVGELVKFYTETIPNFIKNIIKFFAELPGKIWDIIVSIPGKIKNALVGGINTVKEGATKIFNAVYDTVKTLPNKVKKIGEDLVKGLWQGIKGMKNWLEDKAKNFFGGFVKGIKNVLGIHSPSVVMEKQVGVNLGLGVVKGLDDTQKQLNNAIGNIATGISANIGSGLNISGTNSSSMRPIFNVYVDSHTDPLGQTVSSIKTFSGGAKNDYNYGVGV